MAQSRDLIQVVTDNSQLDTQLNLVLQRIADRLDKIEGLRGTATIESHLVMSGNNVQQVASPVNNDDATILSNLPGQDLDTSDSPSFSGVTATGAIQYIDSNGTVIHSFGA